LAYNICRIQEYSIGISLDSDWVMQEMHTPTDVRQHTSSTSYDGWW